MDAKYMVNLQDNVIETTVTCKASVVNEWIRDVRSTAHCFQNIVGIDRQCVCEMFSGYKTSLLQMCIGTKCLLYQPFYLVTDSTLLLESFFRDTSLIFVGVNIEQKKSGGDRSFMPYFSIDIEALAVERWCWPKKCLYWRPGLKVLARSVADLNIERPEHVMLTNWCCSKQFSVEQIEYACIDVYAAFRIGRELLKHGNGMHNMMKSADDDDD